MRPGDQGSIDLDIESIRRLADVLDIELGVKARKAIMAGNEQLTIQTGSPVWSTFLTGVSDRLSSVVGDEGKDALLSKAGLFTIGRS